MRACSHERQAACGDLKPLRPTTARACTLRSARARRTEWGKGEEQVEAWRTLTLLTRPRKAFGVRPCAGSAQMSSPRGTCVALSSARKGALPGQVLTCKSAAICLKTRRHLRSAAAVQAPVWRAVCGSEVRWTAGRSARTRRVLMVRLRIGRGLDQRLAGRQQCRARSAATALARGRGSAQPWSRSHTPFIVASHVRLAHKHQMSPGSKKPPLAPKLGSDEWGSRLEVCKVDTTCAWADSVAAHIFLPLAHAESLIQQGAFPGCSPRQSLALPLRVRCEACSG